MVGRKQRLLTRHRLWRWRTDAQSDNQFVALLPDPCVIQHIVAPLYCDYTNHACAIIEALGLLRAIVSEALP